MTQASLQRLIVTFKREELILHALYKTQDGPGPNTKARTRVVADLAKTGLEQALEELIAEHEAKVTKLLKGEA
jgi:hypothetical protein